MNMEVELGELLVIQLLASSFFGKFEVETPALRKIVKWLIIDGVTIGLYFLIGHWSVLVPLLAMIPGTIYHFTWCKKNDINPLTARPRRRYYQLRGWNWED